MVYIKRCILVLVFLFIILVGGNREVFSDNIIFSNDQIIDSRTVNFQSLTVKDGISNNYITNILQDSKGYIWIGTKDGLNRYDGKNVEVYEYDYID